MDDMREPSFLPGSLASDGHRFDSRASPADPTYDEAGFRHARPPDGEAMQRLTDEQFRSLFVFRYALRRFLLRSAESAAAVGLTSQQHQLLLILRARPQPTPPSIREVAEYLLVRHHSAVELVARVEAMGLVSRHPDPLDQRVVRLKLTPRGLQRIEEMAPTHLEELSEVAGALNISEELISDISQSYLQDVFRDIASTRQGRQP
jgi:DNA-binding MarR family transcriptional regulator